MPEKIENRRIPYFGDFVLFDEIGRGGMGVVYSAQQTKLDRPVALKVLHSEFASGDAGMHRLRIEAEAAAKLDHPNIVPIYEFGEHEGHPYLAMQLVEGESLAERIKRLGPNLGAINAATFLVKIAHAVHHAHQRGVLHRDLKPGNILLDETGEPHLIDFGLAKCLEQDSGMTQTGAFLGTPAYASPEQAAGQNKSITTASDVYSLGAVLYALLTGQPPFAGASPAETIERVRNSSPRRPCAARPEVPGDLEVICLKCLEKEPARRYLSALELAEDLERFLAGKPILARPVALSERFRMWAKRHPVHAALAVTGCIAILTPFLLWSQQVKGSRMQERILRRQLLLREVQALRLNQHLAGWSAQSWDRLRAAAKVQTGAEASELRDQAAAALAGLDAMRVDAITNYGADVAVWNRGGTQLLVGGVRAGNQVWQAAENQVQVLPQTNAEWVTFCETGAACHLEYDVSNSLFRLVNSTNGEIVRQWAAGDDAVRALLSGQSPDTVKLVDQGRSGAAVFTMQNGSDETAIVQLSEGAIRLLERVSHPITALTISDDGEAIAVADDRNTIRAWLLRDRRKLPEFQTGRSKLLSLALRQVAHTYEKAADVAQDRWLLATGDAGGGTYVWKLDDSGPPVPCPRGHYGVSALAFSPDGATLASGGMGPVKLWDTATGKPLLDIAAFGAGQQITSLAFAPDENRLAITCRGGTGDGKPLPSHAQVWALDFGRGLATLRGLAAQISKVCFSPDGGFVAALSHDWEIGIWDSQTHRLLRVIEAPPGSTADNASLAFSPSGRRLAFSTFNEARLWNVENGREVTSWPLPEGFADTLGFLKEDELFLFRLEPAAGDKLASATEWTCCVRQLLPIERSLELVDSPRRVRATATALGGKAFVVDGFRCATNRGSAVVSCYEAASGKLLWSLPSHRTDGSSAVVADAFGKTVSCLLSNSPNALLLDAAAGNVISTLGVDPSALSMSQGIYAVGSGLGFSLTDSSTATPLVSLGIDVPSPVAVQFSPDVRLLAWGNQDGTVTVCDLSVLNAKLAAFGEPVGL